MNLDFWDKGFGLPFWDMSAVTIVHHAVWIEKIDRVQAVHKDEQLLLFRNSRLYKGIQPFFYVWFPLEI
jgi:hypothetical protein